MPGLYVEPHPIVKGRGSAPGTRKKVVRRRRKARSFTPKQQSHEESAASIERYIGQDLVNWKQQNTLPEAEHRDEAQPEMSRAAKKPKTTSTKETPANLESATVRPWTRHAIALDTRVLDTNNATASQPGNSILADFSSFLHVLEKRGVQLVKILSTAPSSKSNDKGTSVRVQVLSNASKPTSARVSPLLDRGELGVCIPKALSASFSWSLLTSMVDKIVKEDSTRPDGMQVPLEISILSTDIALFSDTNPTEHVDAFAKFWQHVQTTQVSRIRLIVAKTGVLVFGKKQDNEQQQSGEAPGEDGNEEQPNYHDAQVKCITAIQEAIDRAQIKTITDTSGVASSAVSTEFSFSVMEGNTVLGYHALSRSLVRSSIFGQEDSSSANYRLSFDLPETADGTQCRVSFDASFQIFPYAVNSPEACRLRDDFRSWSHNKPFQLVQMVPLNSIDVGLLHGIPLTLRSAMTGDLNQFQEMDVLVRVLFRFLQERELAILLQSSTAQQQDEVFLLMAQEFPKATQQPPQTGLLFRYANADQLLAEATPARPCPIDDVLGQQYIDYVEDALSTLDCDSFNPLLSASHQQDSVVAFMETTITAYDPLPQDATSPGTGTTSSNKCNECEPQPPISPLRPDNSASEGNTADTTMLIDNPEEKVAEVDDFYTDPDEDIWMKEDAVGIGSVKHLPLDPIQEDSGEDDDDEGFPSF